MIDLIKVSLQDEFMEPKSDIVIKIDFDPGEGSAARVFDIASDLIRAFESLDRLLVSSIDSTIRTQLILEDLEKSSLKIFLRNVLRETDDQALKDLDWKPQVGKYLVKSKYAILEWLDRDIGEDDPAPIEDLTEKVSHLARETDVRHLPDYPPINPIRLVGPLDELQKVKARFRETESLTITLDESEYSVDLGSDWLPSERIPISETKREMNNTVDMVLVIRKPDFLGVAQWNFKHGAKVFNASIDDEDWMMSFHLGEVTIRPGDALHVRVSFDYKYDANGDLIDKEEKIIKVLDVLHSEVPAKELFDN